MYRYFCTHQESERILIKKHDKTQHRQNPDRTGLDHGSDHGPDHGSDRGSDYGSDHGSDHRKKNKTKF